MISGPSIALPIRALCLLIPAAAIPNPAVVCCCHGMQRVLHKHGQAWHAIRADAGCTAQGTWQYYAFNVSQDDYQVVVSVDEADDGTNSTCAPWTTVPHAAVLIRCAADLESQRSPHVQEPSRACGKEHLCALDPQFVNLFADDDHCLRSP